MTTENNRLLAEFMNINKSILNSKGIRLNFENSRYNTYHKDWNWLMKVVEKIEKLDFYEYGVEIYGLKCTIRTYKKIITVSTDDESKITAVYNACLEFIKWYNKNVKSAGKIKTEK